MIGTIVIGVIFGAVAKLLTPGRDLAGLIVTSMLGVAGALLAAYLGQALSLYDANAAARFLAAAVGAFYLSLHFEAHCRRGARGPWWKGAGLRSGDTRAERAHKLASCYMLRSTVRGGRGIVAADVYA